MIKNITIGQYYPVQSKIHSLDPRVKLLATFLYITVLFLLANVWGYLLTIFFVCVVVYISNVPPVYMLKGLRAIFFIIMFTVVLNIFFTPGATVVFQWGVITITQEGLVIAIQMCVRLVLLIIGSSVLTLTTSPLDLTNAVEYLLKPLKRFGVPAHEIAMMMTIALRFIPTLLEEMDKIMKAQMARGADFDTGGITKKAKSLIPLLVPLFVSSFRRADELAIAMEARCYQGDINRTRMKEMRFQPSDYQAIGIVVVTTVLIYATRFLSFF